MSIHHPMTSEERLFWFLLLFANGVFDYFILKALILVTMRLFRALWSV